MPGALSTSPRELGDLKSSATTGVKAEPISFDPQARRARGRVLLATRPLRAKRVCTCWQTTARFRAGQSSAPPTHPYAVAFGIIWRRVSELFGARPDVKGMSCVWEATPVSSKL